jgi:hypothetical protein
MIRRMMFALVLVAAAVPASAQMPPSIQKPIDAAKRQANKTSSQINNEQKAGNDQGSKAAAMPTAAAQSPAGSQSTAQKGAAATKTATDAKAASDAKAAAAADSAKKRGSVTQNGTKASVTFYRETFTYESDGRRDPFLSLMATGELRPMISDLTLVGIIYDESGRNSVAILVDASAAGQSYRKKVGDVLGRMKITKISERDITLNVDEFGFARQETLLIDRTPRTGARRPQ